MTRSLKSTLHYIKTQQIKEKDDEYFVELDPEILQFFAICLTNEETEKSIIHEVAHNLLDFINHYSDLSGLISDVVCELNHAGDYEMDILSYDWDEINRGKERFDLDSWDLSDYTEPIIEAILVNNWQSIIEERLQVEAGFKNPEDFVNYRNFITVCKYSGFNIYTKDIDGDGFDLIGEIINTDLVHSSYLSVEQVMENFGSEELTELFADAPTTFGFAEFNYSFISGKGRHSFGGPRQESEIFPFLKGKEEQLQRCLDDLAKSLDLDATFNFQLRPDGDDLFFNLSFERRLPEVFYDLAGHTNERGFN